MEWGMCDPPNGVDAYHKHDCLAVLGRGDEAVDGLYRWVAKIRENDGRVVVRPRQPAPTDHISLMLHGTERAVIEFPEASVTDGTAAVSADRTRAGDHDAA
jgi:hypothetical protein